MNPRIPTAAVPSPPSGEGGIRLVVDNTTVQGSTGADRLAVGMRGHTEAALSGNSGMDEGRWWEIHRRLSASFASEEFRNATAAMLPSSLSEAIAYIHEVFKIRLLNQKVRQRHLANLLRRAKRGDLISRWGTAKPLSELIQEIKNMPIGNGFDERELDFWEDVLALDIWVQSRDIRQFVWHAQVQGKDKCVYIKSRKRNETME